MFKDSRVNNICLLDLDGTSRYGTKCLVPKNEDSLLWHQHLGHIHFDLINTIVSKNLVIGTPNINFYKDKLSYAFQMGKQMRFYFKPKNVACTLHNIMVLFSARTLF